MKKIVIIVAISLILGLGIGFFLGMEYKAYQVRIAIEKAFTTPSNTTPEKSETVLEQAKEEEMQVIEKKVGDEIILSALKFKISKTEEKQTISSGYGSPKTAKEGAKFVIVNLAVTNITNTKFSFFPDDGFRLVDNQKREFTAYSDTIGSIANYLNSRELSPSINEAGVIVYEIPSDATNYSIVVGKSGTKELYKIVLK